MADAGWYNDKSDPALARWHDGVDWTDHVLVKAEWPAGVEPPPPQVWEPEVWQAGEAARPGRFRIAVGSAAVLAVLVVAGVALAQDGGDDPSDGTPTGRRSETSDRVSDVAGDLGDGTTIDPATIEPIFGDGADDGSGGSSSGSGTSGTTKGTTRGTARSGTVEHTETSTKSSKNTGAIDSGPSDNQVDVGHTSDVTIKTNTTIKSDPTTTTPTEPTTTTTTGSG